MLRPLLTAVAILLLSTVAQATQLLAIAGSSGARRLFEVDPTTGSTQMVAGLPDRVWGDITGRPGDTQNVYSVARIPGDTLESRVSAIDVSTGAVTDLYSFTDLSFAPDISLELSGIAIAPSSPSIATITGVLLSFPLEGFLFDLDLETGATSNFQILVVDPPVADLTYSADETLYTLTNGGEFDPSSSKVGTINRSTGQVSPVGCVSSACSYQAIEFDPVSGALYGIRGNLLNLLSPTTGVILDEIGPTGLPFVSGIAFVVPEPGTGALLMVGLVGYGLAARHRRNTATRQSPSSR